jgi:hypothetical protein
MPTPEQQPEWDAEPPNEEFAEAEASARASGASARRALVTWILLGTGAGAALSLAALGFLSLIRFDAPPELTPARYYEAVKQWETNAPPNYDIEVEITGPQSAHYRVEVRGGEPTSALRNGVPIKQRRVYGTWSVPGMFGTMSRDVEALERRAAGQAQANEQELVLRAQFDPVYGYPARYERIEWGSARGSTSTAAMWQVTRFKLVE